MNDLIEQLVEILEDNSIPKNVRSKIQGAMDALKEEDKEDGFKANKALQELDEIADDANIPSYIRPQIWNVVSQLETL
ncbi:hypothetical protein CL616_04865 [archaeon]|nr:hypothetical protein [archaeon]|tara:strand:- start:596 stop:829 length:234 start_codon:yes stop_codon:yes gene_type:complete